ncbi:ribosome-binding protein 1-like [Saccostrea cucullata]|uniref:ribosome-binding protein 1-like n=1 Tax=Saccostrea cuccullata TaxID=36930 RepID=UPI002ED30869
MHALVEWTDEEKVSTITLSRIKEPRKDFCDYKVGDIVQASCHGFPGVHPAKILAIRGSTTDGKKQLEKMAEDYIAEKNQVPTERGATKKGRKSTVKKDDPVKKAKSQENKENKAEREKKREENKKKREIGLKKNAEFLQSLQVFKNQTPSTNQQDQSSQHHPQTQFPSPQHSNNNINQPAPSLNQTYHPFRPNNGQQLLPLDGPSPSHQQFHSHHENSQQHFQPNLCYPQQQQFHGQNQGTPHQQQFHSGMPHQQQFHQGSPHQQQFHPGTPQQQQFHQGMPHQQQFHQGTPHQQQFQQGTPHQQQFKQGTPHQQQFHQGTPHQQQFHQGTPSQQQFHQGTPHQQQFHQNGGTFHQQQTDQHHDLAKQQPSADAQTLSSQKDKVNSQQQHPNNVQANCLPELHSDSDSDATPIQPRFRRFGQPPDHQSNPVDTNQGKQERQLPKKKSATCLSFTEIPGMSEEISRGNQILDEFLENTADNTDEFGEPDTMQCDCCKAALKEKERELEEVKRQLFQAREELEQQKTSNGMQLTTGEWNTQKDGYPRAGRVPKEIAENHSMMELMPGSGIYVYPKDVRALNKKTSGTGMARYLMSVFYTNEELVRRGNLTGANGKEGLDKSILKTIVDYAVVKGRDCESNVKFSMRTKISSLVSLQNRKQTCLS